ncbi:MAG: hypothetical protein AAGA57_10775 [Planctomycetota bacterium]
MTQILTTASNLKPMPSRGRITDAHATEGGLVVQLEGYDYGGRKSHIAVMDVMKDSWPLSAIRNERVRVTTDGQSIISEDSDQSISIEDVVAGSSTMYFARWSSPEKRSAQMSDAVGIWRHGAGWTLVSPEGSIRQRGDWGRHDDDEGMWRWTQLDDRRFRVDRADVAEADRLTHRFDYQLSRYDGRILELVYRSWFLIEPEGVPGVAIWIRDKGPKAWQSTPAV